MIYVFHLQLTNGKKIKIKKRTKKIKEIKEAKKPNWKKIIQMK